MAAAAGGCAAASGGSVAISSGRARVAVARRGGRASRTRPRNRPHPLCTKRVGAPTDTTQPSNSTVTGSAEVKYICIIIGSS
jgi:hypothetical protein